MIYPMLAPDQAKYEEEAQAAALEWYQDRCEQLTQAVVDLKQQVAELQCSITTLQQSECLFRTTFEQAAVGIAHVAPDGRWLRVNQHLCDLLGYSRDELLQSNFQAFSHPADLFIDLQAATHLLANEIQTYTLHKRYPHKQGHTIWANLTVSLVRDSSHRPLYFVSVVEDITQLKQAEQALQQSEERYRRVVEDQTDLICRFDRELRLTFVNQPYSRAFGKGPDAMIGKSIVEVIPPDYQSHVCAHLATLNATQRVGTFDNPIRLADGTWRWFHWTNQLIVDNTGEVIEYQSIGRDITARKQAEDAERKQYQYTEALCDSLVMLTSSLDIEKVLQQILIGAASVVPSEAGSIVLFEDTHGHVAYLRGYTPEAEAFFAEYRFPLNLPTFQNVLAGSQPYFIRDTQTTPAWVVFPVTNWIRSSIGIPIELRGKVIGLLIADSAIPDQFNSADIEKLQVFARYASLALENADHVTKLEQRVAERTGELRYYAGLQENVNDAVISTDLDFRIRSWNRAAETVYGWCAADVIGKPVSVVLQTYYASPALRERALQELWRQGWWHGEVVQRHKNGTVLHILSSVTILKDEAGTPFGIVVVNHNITERKYAEEALQTYAAEVSALYNNAPCGYHSLNQAGCFIQINDTELRWLGYRREEVIGRLKLSDFLTPASQKLFEATFPLFKEQGWIKDIEYELQCKDGRVMHVLLSAVAVYDEQGQYVASRTTLYDISERKEAQRIIYENERKFRLLVEVAPLAILITDQQGQITLVNEQAEQLFGYTRHELLGKPVECLVPAAKRTLHPQYRAAGNVSTPTVRRMARGRELFAVRKDGTEFPVEIQLSFAEQQAGCFIMDITTRKQAEEALQQALATEKNLSELKSRFVSMASHEFRTPLSTIFSLTETLLAYRHQFTDEQVVQRLTKIQEQIGYLNTLMEGVLELAHTQARHAEFKPAPLDLDALCRTMIDEFQSQPAVTVRLSYICEGTPLIVLLDKRLMRQLINNLVSNALKYSTPNQTVVVKLAYQEASIVFQVCDQGIGIPDADLKHLFEPFHRAANASTIAGTGLGLVIVKEAVELHGGTITVESKLNIGTTFTVHLPL